MSALASRRTNLCWLALVRQNLACDLHFDSWDALASLEVWRPVLCFFVCPSFRLRGISGLRLVGLPIRSGDLDIRGRGELPWLVDRGRGDMNSECSFDL